MSDSFFIWKKIHSSVVKDLWSRVRDQGGGRREWDVTDRNRRLVPWLNYNEKCLMCSYCCYFSILLSHWELHGENMLTFYAIFPLVFSFLCLNSAGPCLDWSCPPPFLLQIALLLLSTVKNVCEWWTSWKNSVVLLINERFQRHLGSSRYCS